MALGALPVDHSGLVWPAHRDHFVLISGQPINGSQFAPIDLSAMKELKLVVPSERHLMGATLLDYITGGEIVAKRVMKVDGFVGTIESIRRSRLGRCMSGYRGHAIPKQKNVFYLSYLQAGHAP